MTFPQDTIKLAAAKRIFEGYGIEEICIDGEVVGYSATVNGQVIQRKGLTDLCTNLTVQIKEALCLSTAQKLFPEFDIKGQMSHGRIIGYVATVGAEIIEAPDLMNLCSQVVFHLQENVQSIK
ncbi:MAG: hypothetical protein F6K42_25075 [Leptolyngbya sp. SIO1D8]|nr:hypothetical protein [Leptolyngbya sp. SIO1D8]